jgi:hypothetical protein
MVGRSPVSGYLRASEVTAPYKVGNRLQMALWAGLFLVLGEFPTFETAFYHSVVNFTTLGYGDVVMSEEKRLLGALEAAKRRADDWPDKRVLVFDSLPTHGTAMEYSDR